MVGGLFLMQIYVPRSHLDVLLGCRMHRGLRMHTQCHPFLRGGKHTFDGVTGFVSRFI